MSEIVKVASPFAELFGLSNPDEDCFPEHRACVYLVRSADGFAKIGVADDTIARVAQLQTGNPHELTLVAVARGGMEAEALLHRKHDDLRRRGEWFTWHDSIRADFLPGRLCHHLKVRPVCLGDGESVHELGRMDRLLNKAAAILGKSEGYMHTTDASGTPVQVFQFKHGWARAEQLRAFVGSGRELWRYRWWFTIGIGFRDGDRWWVPERAGDEEQEVDAKDMDMIAGLPVLSSSAVVRIDTAAAVEMIANSLAEAPKLEPVPTTEGQQ